MMNVDVLGIGAWSIAYRGWPALAAACASDEHPTSVDASRPLPRLLPPAERRRAPDGVAVALEVASEAVAMAARFSMSQGIDPRSLASVFTSAHGDLAIVDYLCSTLAGDPTALSPTRFHLSVHNAAAGHWSIAAGDRAPSTALAADADSFALGLLEAATMAIAERRAVLLVAFDTPAVGLLARATKSSALFGFALVLRSSDQATSEEGIDGPEPDTVARLTLSIESFASVDGEVGRAAMPMPARPTLETLALSSAAAKALALAEALAVRGRTVVRYPLGPSLALSIVVDRSLSAGHARDITIK